MVNPARRPARHGVEPRTASRGGRAGTPSLVIRAGYGVYYNTSVYQPIATEMAQQSPLSRSLSVPNTQDNPLTLANGLNVTPANTPNTFAIDPNFRVGYAQNWDAPIQRDLPGSLVATATYLGIKGTRAQQEFLPNTFPAGAQSLPAVPAGLLTSPRTAIPRASRDSCNCGGAAQRHRGSRAVHFSKSIDDAALGGRGQGTAVIAQNWLDLAASAGFRLSTNATCWRCRRNTARAWESAEAR